MLYEFIRARTDGMRRAFDLDGYTYWSKEFYQETKFYKAPIDTCKFEEITRDELIEVKKKRYPNFDFIQVIKIGIVL